MHNIRSVLVTGASGFVGRTLLGFLGDYAVIPLVRTHHRLPNEIVLDFTARDSASEIEKLPAVDAIIHLGTKIDWNASREELFIPNVLATANLASWAKSMGAYFIFASTAIVCGANTALITKATEPKPDTNYAYSKWQAEETIRRKGIEHLILRLSGVYGKEGSQHLGINKAIAQALKGKTPTQFGDGAGKRNYLYVVDLVKVIVNCLKERVTGTHLVAGAEVISIADMLKTICEVFSLGSPIYKEGRRGGNQVVEHSETIDGIRRKFRGTIGHIKLWNVKN